MKDNSIYVIDMFAHILWLFFPIKFIHIILFINNSIFFHENIN